MEIEQVETGKLIPYANNARVHSEEQIGQIVASIKEFGFNNPILCDGEKGIIAGHGRLVAAQKLELEHVPVIELGHLSEAQKRAYILADNKIAENATWDMGLVSTELEDLVNMGRDVEVTGFNMDELIILDKPEKAIGEKKGKEPQLVLRFENSGDFKKVEEDIRAILENKKINASVSCGEV